MGIPWPFLAFKIFLILVPFGISELALVTLVGVPNAGAAAAGAVWGTKGPSTTFWRILSGNANEAEDALASGYGSFTYSIGDIKGCFLRLDDWSGVEKVGIGTDIRVPEGVVTGTSVELDEDFDGVWKIGIEGVELVEALCCCIFAKVAWTSFPGDTIDEVEEVELEVEEVELELDEVDLTLGGGGGGGVLELGGFFCGSGGEGNGVWGGEGKTRGEIVGVGNGVVEGRGKPCCGPVVVGGAFVMMMVHSIG